jgi:dTDP-4-amino-4,6-dideoxygalactose transaminase
MLKARDHQDPHMRLSFLRPQLPALDDVASYFRLSEGAGRYSNFGPCHELLATRLGARVGHGARAVPVANCTLGLMVALRALTEGTDGAARFVATPSYAFPATTQAIAWCGLRPVFVDADPASWHMDVASLQRAVEQFGEQLAAVMACSTFGSAPSEAERTGWEATCRGAGLPLVVDSAAGWGSLDEQGFPLGAQGDAEVFSFHATKPMPIGEGGAVVTRDEATHDRLRRLVNFGFKDHSPDPVELGLNAKLSEIHAATALAALDLLDARLDTRRAIAARVRERIEPLGFVFQPGAERSCWSAIHVLAPDADTRRRVLDVSSGHGIEIRSYYDPPAHRSKLFSECPRVDGLAVTTDLASRALSLPIADDLSDAEIDAVVACLREALR